MNIDDSNFELCLKRISEKGGVAAREAQRILEEVSDHAETLRQSGATDPYIQAAQELSDRVRTEAQLDRADTIRNAKIRAGILKKVETAGGIKSAENTIRSLLHGTNIGARDSIESQWKGLAAGWQGLLSWKLKKAGVEKAAISGAIDRDIAREIWGMNQGKEGQVTRNGPARQIAEAIQPMLDNVRERLNAVGARIGDAKDYVTSTLHSPDKMRAAAGSMRDTPDKAFAKWWKDTEPLLAEKTFEGVTPGEGESMDAARQKFGRSVYDALVSGVHMADGPVVGDKGFLPKGEGGYIPAAFEGSRNIAKKISQGRTLFWKDADSWFDYVSTYGRQKSLTEGVMHALDRGARKLALMDKLGTNPAGNLNLVMRRVQETYRSDLDSAKAFSDKISGIDAVMQHLDGRATMPANAMSAGINASIRALESMADLGGVGITHFASIWPTVTSEMAHHGVPRLKMLGNLAAALLKGKGGAEREEILSQIGAYSGGLTRDMFARFTPDDPIPGRVASLANVFMKYTGIHYVFDNTQAAVRETLANQLARSVGKGFGELEPHLSQMIGKYGIGKDEWELLRGVNDLPAANGLGYMTPADALRINPEDAEALLRSRGEIAADAKPEEITKATGQFAQSLSDRLYGYYGDAASHSVVTAGVRERAAVMGVERPGSFGGEMRRYLMQFKMWPLAAMNQIVGREIHMSLSKGDLAWNVGTLMALSMAGGYVRMSVNDLALGHPVRSPTDPRTMIAALAQGGGVGILGDFLFGEVMRNRFGSGVIGTLGGPVVSDVDSLLHVYNDWLHGKASWPDIARFGVKHIPFANLVYLKGALDYMLWYHLYEAASPGWWERTNRRMIKEQGRAVQGYAPGRGVPWTPFGIGASP